MSESELVRQLTRLRVAFAGSPLNRFLQWWGGELLQLLPARLRALLAERRDEVLLALLPDAVTAERRGKQPQAEQRIERAADPSAARSEVERLLQGEEAPLVVLCLPPERALLRQLSLPAAAEATLRQVLSFEMDRQTPFRADQVHYDCRVVARDEASRQIEVELALVPRATVNADLAALSEIELALDVMDLRGQGDAPRMGFNLLPPEQRAVRRNLWLRVNLALGAVVIGLLVAVMAQSVSNRQIALESLQAATDAERNKARQVAALRANLKTAIEGANFLTERKRTRPAISDVLLDVTDRLANDTWLQRLSLNGDQLQLQGQSREAAGLITILQQSPYLEAPALQGAITPDARTGKEQFLIQAKARPLPQDAAAPVPATPARGLPRPDAAPARTAAEKPAAVAARSGNQQFPIRAKARVQPQAALGSAAPSTTVERRNAAAARN